MRDNELVDRLPSVSLGNYGIRSSYSRLSHNRKPTLETTKYGTFVKVRQKVASVLIQFLLKTELFEYRIPNLYRGPNL